MVTFLKYVDSFLAIFYSLEEFFEFCKFFLKLLSIKTFSLNNKSFNARFLIKCFNSSSKKLKLHSYDYFYTYGFKVQILTKFINKCLFS